MLQKLTSDSFKLSSNLSTHEKLKLMNEAFITLIDHFHNKANKGKQLFELYKYSSIALAAVTTIIAALQVIYPAVLPKWMLPVTSAVAIVAVAFLGASGAQKIWINPRTTQQHLQAEHLLFNQQAGKYHHTPQEEAVKIFSERMW